VVAATFSATAAATIGLAAVGVTGALARRQRVVGYELETATVAAVG
jgi:hypothetical protein